MNTSSLRSATPSSSSHDLPADCSNQVDETARLEWRISLRLPRNIRVVVCELFRLTADFVFAGAYAVYRLGDRGFIAHIVALTAQHASGSV